MISDTTGPVRIESGPRRKWLKPSAERVLSLAAAPTFAVMALLAGVGDGGMQGMCSDAHASPLTGMAAMYALMSAFHAPPWLRVIRRRQGSSG